MKNKIYVKICPKCGSTNNTIPPAGRDIHMTMPDYCKNCENRGLFPEIEKSKIPEFRKELKKKKK
ncbi:hypothetical protein JXB41_04330 [Candidatus Woesearchaeota archaeon]|nr:hypothetical protein [Candidatus Woesearchaeota archaeon]